MKKETSGRGNATDVWTNQNRVRRSVKGTNLLEGLQTMSYMIKDRRSMSQLNRQVKDWLGTMRMERRP